MSYRKLHYAQCSECGYEIKHAESSTFIDEFFMPRICKNCGVDLDCGINTNEDRPHWKHVNCKQKWQPGQLSWNPSDWLGQWVTIEKSEGKVY